MTAAQTREDLLKMIKRSLSELIPSNLVLSIQNIQISVLPIQIS
jgi:hypothetical protein